MAKIEHTCQKLTKIYFEHLKCLKNVEIDFSEKNLVAIMAPNGMGKSTVLHALACVYKRNENPKNKDDRFSKFFLPTSNTTWQGSRFKIFYEYRIREKEFKNQYRLYEKKRDRWCRYENRPQRHVVYVGIDTCVPSIEKEKYQTSVKNLNREPLDSETDRKVKEYAAYVMNREYSDYCQQSSNDKKYISVGYGSILYSSLSMGAGEQRIFYILRKMLQAPDYSMILIDEIDLLLHEEALSRLLDKLNEIANSKKMQVIFTTHAHSILNKTYIAFRHLFQMKDKTLCFNKTYPECLSYLTGKMEKQFAIYVEDGLAEAIVRKVCAQKGVSKFLEIHKFGVWTNAITAACGLSLNGDSLENKLFVVDGDSCCSDEENWEHQIRCRIDGDDSSIKKNRDIVFSAITKFCIDQDKNPEEYYRQVILSLSRSELEIEQQEIYDLLYRQAVVADKHEYLNNIFRDLSISKEVGYEKIVSLLSQASQWCTIVKNVSDWIDNKTKDLILTL